MSFEEYVCRQRALKKGEDSCLEEQLQKLKKKKKSKKVKGETGSKTELWWFCLRPVLYSLFHVTLGTTCIKLPSQALWISDSRRMAMGRGVRVFHAPGQSPYSVLVEQRGVDQLLLLESQVKLNILTKQGCLFQETRNEKSFFSGHPHSVTCWGWTFEENLCKAVWCVWDPWQPTLECRRGEILLNI